MSRKRRVIKDVERGRCVLLCGTYGTSQQLAEAIRTGPRTKAGAPQIQAVTPKYRK
jgi:hypothetical protein